MGGVYYSPLHGVREHMTMKESEQLGSAGTRKS